MTSQSFLSIGPAYLRHVVKRHAGDKQGQCCTHRNEPSARLRIHDLNPRYFVVSRSAPQQRSSPALQGSAFPLNRRHHLAKRLNGAQKVHRSGGGVLSRKTAGY
jgi:hypothetical protein